MPASRRCWAEVDLSALRENLAWIRHRVGPAVKIMTVVKADAYGHGLKQIAALLMQSGTDIFGVANLIEAQAIRSVGKGWPILMLGACLPDEVETAVREGVTSTLSTLKEAERLAVVAKKMNKSALAHLKIDTGMGRLGVRAEEARALLEGIQRLPGIKVSGIYTHFAAVEDDPEFSLQQKKRFRAVVNELMEQYRRAAECAPHHGENRRAAECAPYQKFQYIHANNSGGLLFEADNVYNTVRPGLLVYGVMPPGQRRAKAELTRNFRAALSWKTRVSFVKEIAAGTSLSYGRSFVAPKPMRVATLTAGYGDGYLRAGSNQAKVLIGGKLCPVLGRITMDQMIADVTRAPEAKSGDEVVLIGEQGGGRISANDLAEWAGTVPWEVLTNITYRVPRIYRGSTAA